MLSFLVVSSTRSIVNIDYHITSVPMKGVLGHALLRELPCLRFLIRTVDHRKSLALSDVGPAEG